MLSVGTSFLSCCFEVVPIPLVPAVFLQSLPESLITAIPCGSSTYEAGPEYNAGKTGVITKLALEL